ncbi:hypothetical protein E3P78_02759 [Wallemia ichthyophaga]|nr:hypothetical protein E3P78_02759 [Wallemia ichthyophaga]
MQRHNIDENNRQSVISWDIKDDSYVQHLGRDTQRYSNIAKSSVKQHSIDNYNELKPSYQWFERPDKDNPLEFDSKVKLLYPKDSNDLVDQLRSKMSISSPIRLHKFHYKDAAQVNEELVPIRLDFDLDYLKLKEVFCYNLKEPHLSPKLLAVSLCHDFGLNEVTAAHLIEKSINDQLDEWKSFVHEYSSIHSPSTSTNTQGTLNNSDCEWWQAFKDNNIPEKYDDQVKSVKDEKFIHEDIRILIKLDIIQTPHHLIDQFEWPLFTTLQPNAPELFAVNFAAEMGLPGEFVTSISHNIREQSSFYLKSLSRLNYPILNGNSVEGIPDDELRKSFLPHLSEHSIERSTKDSIDHTPKLDLLSHEDIINYEKELEKESKRRKRAQRNRRSNLTLLPQDREPIKTYRTPPKFPETFISVPHSFLKEQPIAINQQTQQNQQLSTNYPRRAAAAKASLNISSSAQAELAEIDNNAEDEDYGADDSQFDNFTSTMEFDEHENKYVKKPMQLQPFDQSKMAITKRPRFIENIPTKLEYTPTSRLRPDAKIFVSNQEKPNNLMKFGHGKAFRGELSPGTEVKKLSAATLSIYSYFSTENQHENMINGVWHCSNCGVPEMFAIGRRKGPMGDKSLCGDCGKYLHKIRKNKPVIYNNDIEYHRNLRLQVEKEAEERLNNQKTNAQRYRKELKASRQAQKVAKEAEHLDYYSQNKRKQIIDDSDEDDSFDFGKRNKHKSYDDDDDDESYNEDDDIGAPSRPQRVRKVPSHQARSPSSSQSEANGDTTRLSVDRPTRQSASTPQWLTDAARLLRHRYPNDRFVIIDKPPQSADGSPEWRIKCLDCPGKMYTPGPGLNVENFEKHLKNRQHKQKVGIRLGFPMGNNGISPIGQPSVLSPSQPVISPISHPLQLQSQPASRPPSSQQQHPQHVQHQQHLKASPMYPTMGMPMSQSPAQQTDVLAAAMYQSHSQNLNHGHHSIPHSQSITPQPQPPPIHHQPQSSIHAMQEAPTQSQHHHLYNHQQFVNIPHETARPAESIPSSLDISSMDMNLIGMPSFDFESGIGGNEHAGSGTY